MELVLKDLSCSVDDIIRVQFAYLYYLIQCVHSPGALQSQWRADNTFTQQFAEAPSWGPGLFYKK